MEKYRIIKTGLKTQKECDILDGVFGQLSDGMWENSRAAGGYWPYIDAELENGEVVLKVSTAYRKYEEPTNKLLNMTDDDIKKWLAKKIKQVIKEEGLDWDRGNEEHTDYLDTEWRKSKQPSTVADCYYVYEVLKGRNVAKHPEYAKQMKISDALKTLDNANIEYVRAEDDEPWDMDESVNFKMRRAVNEKDDSEPEMTWVILEYNGTNPKIRAKCRKVYTDEQLAEHKILSQIYIYDIIHYPDNWSDRRKAEKEIIKRNLDVIKSEDWFSIGGPNYDRMIYPDELDAALDESAISWPMLFEADLTPEQKEARRRRRIARREKAKRENHPYYVKIFQKSGNIGGGWWVEKPGKPEYQAYKDLATLKKYFGSDTEALINGARLDYEDGEAGGPGWKMRLCDLPEIPDDVLEKLNRDLAKGVSMSHHSHEW